MCPRSPRRLMSRGKIMPNFFSKLLSHGADKQLKEFEAIAEKVNDLEPQVKALSDEDVWELLGGDDNA